MKRNKFIKNVLFAFVAAMLPKTTTHNNENASKQEEIMALTEIQKARSKMRDAIIKSKPQGKYIDLRTLRHWAERGHKKLQKEYFTFGTRTAAVDYNGLIKYL